MLRFSKRLSFAARTLGFVITLAARPASAAQSEEAPAQREWTYQDYADVVTGDPYPAAGLMSRKLAATSIKDADVGYGYLAVGNYSKRPMEVMLGWDETYSKQSAAKCRPGGCEVTIRLGESNAMKFVALQDKHSPTLYLQGGHPFVSAAARHVGTIEVEVKTVNYGIVSLQFSTVNRLQTGKLASSNK